MKMPVTFSPTQKPDETDLYQDQEVGTCMECGCVQLQSLIDPKVLYDSSHNNTYETPTWKDHHVQFCDFVISHMTNMDLLEIGGSSGIFYNHLKEKKPDTFYTCMDLCDPNPSMEFSFVKGNCETFNFENIKTIVMSHVFEHLYNPSVFVENIAKCSVERIFLSIPNMEHLLSVGSPSVVFNEHTYYIDSTLLQWLFSQYGYDLVHSQPFKLHSLFFHFVKSDTCTKQLLQMRPQIAEKMMEIQNTIAMRFQRQTVPPNSFFVPAGHLGQLLHCATKPTTLLGFIDNDPAKQGHRVYGTPHFVYSFDILRNYQNEEVNIFLYGGPYTTELKEQIQSIHSTARIHII